GEVEQRGAGQGAGRQRRLVAGMMVVRRVRHGLLPVTRRARSVRRGNVGDVGRVVGHGGRGGGAVLAAGGEQRGERGGGGGEQCAEGAAHVPSPQEAQRKPRPPPA